jgi:DNA-directed RNA polymerase subunit beta'
MLVYGECDWIEIDDDSWTAKMVGVPDSKQRYTSEPERIWRLRLSPSSHIAALNSGEIETFNVDVFERSDDVKILSNHSAQIMIVDADYEILEHHRLMYGDELLFENGDSVAKGQQLASFDPYFQKIVAEPSGIVAYFDLIEGQTLETIYDVATGITSRTVLSENQSNSLKPHIKILSTDGQVRMLSDGSPATYSLPARCHIIRDEGDEVQPGDVLASISLQDAY